MTLDERIDRIARIFGDCAKITDRIKAHHNKYLLGQADQVSVERDLKSLETLEAAAVRHTHILHHEASQLVITTKVGGGDKDEEYP